MYIYKSCLCVYRWRCICASVGGGSCMHVEDNEGTNGFDERNSTVKNIFVHTL